jgi:hypothetical protein
VPREESIGYYAEDLTAQRYYPVAFNREHCCWVELRWSTRDPTDHYWITVRPTSDDLNCNIPSSERLPVDQQGPLDDHEPAVVERRQAVSRSHKGAAGMRSVLTFEKVIWIVDARVER